MLLPALLSVFLFSTASHAVYTETPVYGFNYTLTPSFVLEKVGPRVPASMPVTIPFWYENQEGKSAETVAFRVQSSESTDWSYEFDYPSVAPFRGTRECPTTIRLPNPPGGDTFMDFRIQAYQRGCSGAYLLRARGDGKGNVLGLWNYRI